MKHLLLICVIICMGLFGCGNDISGTLTMSDIAPKDLGGGRFEVDATATYVPVAGKEATGAAIDFTAVYTTASNPKPYHTSTSKVILGISGVAAFMDTADQGNEPVIVRLTASIGGLSQTKIISIPVIAALTASPIAISFLNTDPVGTAQTVTVSGGFLPYTVASALPGDIGAAIPSGGSAVTITKLALGSAILASTTVTIIDSMGNTFLVPVGYYK